jgi:predicted methyltransferase
MKVRLFGTAVVLALTATLGVLARQAGVVAPPDVHPISGRRFAQVMSAAGADWLSRPERVEEEEPDRALDVLKIPKGAVVADVGAGSGYMTVKLSKKVGPTGKVYANDIQAEMLRLLGLRLKADKISNVTLVQGEVDNPQLPESTLDLELLVDV